MYTRETYSGLMLGTHEEATKFMLEDLKACFVPEKWQRYEFVSLGLNKDWRELPPVVVVALLVKSYHDGRDAVQAAAWFQSEFFQTPSDEIVELISELRWPITTVEDAFYS